VLALVDRVTRRMRAKGRAGRTVVLRMRFGDFGRATRSHTLPAPTSATSAVLAEMRTLLAAERELIEERGLTMVGVTISNLQAGSRQLQLPIDERQGDVLDHVLDEVRDRFGATAVTRAALLHRAPRLATWLFPGDDD
jgi:DNA polymerase-4